MKYPPQLFETTQTQTAVNPNTSNDQDAGIYFQKELKHFLEPCSFANRYGKTR